MDFDDRIDTRWERTDHIPLTCVHHPHLRWHTKNISHIGARSIFFSGGWFDGEFKDGYPYTFASDMRRLFQGTLKLRTSDDGPCIDADFTDLEHVKRIVEIWEGIADEWAISCACPRSDLRVVEPEVAA